jgi:hypothetical protein
MASSFLVYIDESGDEGFQFGGGSSQWFVLSAVITRRATDLDTVKLVDHTRTHLAKPPRKPLHFKDLKHEQRLPYISRIASAELKTVSVLVHKPSLLEPEKFQERYRLYFYTTRYLLERVSWYCRDHTRHADEGDGSAEIVFSNRSGMSYPELCEDLRQLHHDSGLFDANVDWNVIRENQVTSLSPGKRMGLQIADAVAGSFFHGVEESQYGFLEPRYAQMLKPVVYRGRAGWLGYGLKFWPREANALLQEERYRWIGEVYK